MPTCETCGNDYDKAFQVVMNGVTHTFDSFECAIHAVAPTCPHCGIHVVGRGSLLHRRNRPEGKGSLIAYG